MTPERIVTSHCIIGSKGESGSETDMMVDRQPSQLVSITMATPPDNPVTLEGAAVSTSALVQSWTSYAIFSTR